MSRTISTVCVICNRHSPSSEGHIGFTSIDMLCQLASNNLCPSSKLEIPALPLHGRSFKKGVKFSVQTTSLGSVPCSKWRNSAEELTWSPTGSKDMTGRIVRVESMKFKEAQKRPDSAFVNVNHRPSALIRLAKCAPTCRLEAPFNYTLFIRLGFHPRPQFHTRAPLSRPSPRPRAPALGIPSPQTEPQM